MTAAEITALVETLAAKGVRSFEGEGIKVEFDRSVAPVETRVVRQLEDAEDDLFYHEARS